MKLPLGLLIAALFFGCGKKAETPTPEPPKSGSSVDSLLNASGSQPAAPPAPAATDNTVAPPPEQKPGELPDYNVISRAVNGFLVKYQRPPRDIEELVAQGFLNKLPPPPPGKKYVLNQRMASLTVVDK